MTEFFFMKHLYILLVIAFSIGLSYNPTVQTNRELFIPNPVQTSYVDIPPSINANTIALYNVQGKQMSNLPGTAERIKMPITSGIYFLRFVFDESVVNKRIVVKAP